uniref:SCP domain-containing protein n=1 Tax=Mesocestoides corti TaxID=53468 RepID=A0A5K3F9V4_MESCO
MLKFICLVTLACWSKSEPLTEEERARILEVHRKIREELEPPASNMMLMDYSFELEKSAKKWLMNCTYILPSASPYPEFKDLEVNLQSGYKREDSSFEPASRFDSQKELHDYEDNTCPSLCGNYRRIVFATSRQIGCYRRLCEHRDFWTTPQYVIACLYKPGRRNRYERPYQRGSSCSGCPRGLGCYRKQCTVMTTPGVVRVPLEEPVVRESAASKKQIVQIQTTTSTTKKPLIQTQKMLSPTKKPLI